MRLFHVSEERGITVFRPRPVSEAWPGLTGRFVWAIEEGLIANNLFPRDCPRICLRATDTSASADIDALMGGERTPLISFDERWATSVERSRLYLYEFRPDDFRLLDECAGYWISETVQQPIHTELVENALQRIRESGVRVQFRSDLESIAGAVVQSSLRFSIIKFRRAPSFGSCG